MVRRSAWLVALIVTAFPLTGVAAFEYETPAPPRLAPAQVETLLGGEPIVSVERNGNENRAELIAIIDADVDDVWSVVYAYEDYPTWFPDQLEARVLSTSGADRRLVGETRVPVIRNRRYELTDRTTRREVDGRTHYVNTWTYVQGSGNVNETAGFWYVQPLGQDPSKTLIRMVLYADLGLWLPPGIINWGTRNMLPGIARGIQSRCNNG
jgi:hypothetical protein